VAPFSYWIATFTYIPLLAGELGATDVTVSLMLSFNLLVYTAANLGASTLSSRLGSRMLVYVSFVLMGVGLAGAALSTSMIGLWAAQMAIGISQGFAYPVLMGLSIRYVDEAQRSSAMGLHQSVYAIGMFAGPWLGGILADAMGLRPMFGATAAAILVVGMLGTTLMEGRGDRAAAA